MIRVSIITPFYNSQKLIIKHFNRLKNLIKKKNIEIIYIDDGSLDDGYFEIKKKIKSFKNFRIYKLKSNKGPGIARNLGIKNSKGDFLVFLDSDDEIVLRNINKLLFFLDKNKSKDIIFCSFINLLKNQLDLSKINIHKKTLLKNFLRTEIDMNPNFYLFRKKFLLKNKISFKFGYYEDINFMFKVFHKFNTYAQFPYKIYKKNKNTKSITGKIRKKNIIDFTRSCIQKKNYFYSELVKNKFVKFEDLQYGLRGDFVAIEKMFSKVKVDKIFKQNIYKKIINLIDKNFNVVTQYDKIVKKKLFKNEI